MAQQNKDEILAKKLSDVLAKHYEKYWLAEKRGKVNYQEINDTLVVQIKQVLTFYENSKRAYGK